MTVPTAAKDLHEPHTFFNHPPSHQALSAELGSLFSFQSVHVLDVFWF